MSEIDQRQDEIIAEFQSIEDWETRYKKLIEFGQKLPEMPVEFKTEDLKVKGCQSQVWVSARREGDRLFFLGDSDALLVRGLVALLLRVYSGATIQDILQSEPKFIKAIGLENKLSPSRANGLVSMIKQIKYYAFAYSQMPK